MQVYLLKFSDDSVYVGKTSRSIEIRYKEHISSMLKGRHSSYKVQLKYEKLGVPEIMLLEDDISSECINGREEYWIQAFDSFYNGLNCTKGGEGQFGEDNSMAKYSLYDYMAIVTCLANTDWTYTQISKELEVSLHVVRQIGNGLTHSYLSDIMPHEYSKMLLKNRKVSVKRTEAYPNVISPTGEEFSVDNAYAFALKHNIGTANFGRLLNKKRKSCQGWTLA